jgi:hypothetical protein
MKKSIYGLLFLCGLFYDGTAQSPVNIIKIVPQSFSKNTLKFSWEHSTSSKASFNVSPFVALYDRRNEKVLGAGLDLAKKIYVSRMDSAAPLKGFYGAASICYAYYQTQYKKFDDTTDGTAVFPYPPLVERSVTEKIHQIGADLFLGYQFPVKKVLYVDVYLGGGLRYSFSSQGQNSNYKTGINDYGYIGVIPKAGIKIGLKI